MSVFLHINLNSLKIHFINLIFKKSLIRFRIKNGRGETAMNEMYSWQGQTLWGSVGIPFIFPIEFYIFLFKRSVHWEQIRRENKFIYIFVHKLSQQSGFWLTVGLAFDTKRRQRNRSELHQTELSQTDYLVGLPKVLGHTPQIIDFDQ